MDFILSADADEPIHRYGHARGEGASGQMGGLRACKLAEARGSLAMIYCVSGDERNDVREPRVAPLGGRSGPTAAAGVAAAK